MQLKYICARGHKIDVLGTSQRLYPMDVFLGHFRDVPRTVLQYCKNIQQLTFQYFMQHIWWSKIENNTTVMCFIIYFQIDAVGMSRGRHFRTLLGRPWDVSPQFMRKRINLIFFASWLYVESTSIRDIFKRVFGLSSKML